MEILCYYNNAGHKQWFIASTLICSIVGSLVYIVMF